MTEADRQEEPATAHPWDHCDGSCDCHIGICIDCGCTNEREAQGEQPAPLVADDEIALGPDSPGDNITVVRERDHLVAPLDVERLAKHYVTAIDCDHEAKTDTVRCSCSVWTGTLQPSVGAAVREWAEHVLSSQFPTLTDRINASIESVNEKQLRRFLNQPSTEPAQGGTE